MSNTILLVGDYRKIQSLKTATGQTPKPGTLVMLDSSGDITVHATQGGYAERMVVLEDALQGKTVDDAYVAGNIVDLAVVAPGTETQVLLAAGQNVAIGDLGCSQGDGLLEKTDTADIVLLVFTEALDLSASAAVSTLVNARWI